MLLRVGDERAKAIDLLLAGLLSSVAGALNAIGFLATGTFTANMTGNASAFAENLADNKIDYAIPFAAILFIFISGAWFAALLIQAGRKWNVRSIYAQAILFEACILMLIWHYSYHIPRNNEISLVLTLSFVMGFQNSITTMISASRVRTTHISGMATDLGIELAALGHGRKERQAAVPKIKLHTLTLSCFVIGGIAGAITYGSLGRWAFSLTAAILFLIAIPEIVRSALPVKSANR